MSHGRLYWTFAEGGPELVGFLQSEQPVAAVDFSDVEVLRRQLGASQPPGKPASLADGAGTYIVDDVVRDADAVVVTVQLRATLANDDLIATRKVRIAAGTDDPTGVILTDLAGVKMGEMGETWWC